MREGQPRILIIRLSAIGDVVRVLPALHALREAHPRARIDWAVERKAVGVLEGHPALDEILVFDRGAGILGNLRAFWAFCREIRENRYDMVVDFHGILKSGVLCWYSGATDRYGFAWPRAQEGSSLCVNHHVHLPSVKLSRLEENLKLCELLAPQHGRAEMSIYVPPEVQDEVSEFYENTFGGGKLVVAMHVPVDRPEKQWPLEYFAALSDKLLSDGRFEVLLTWGPGQLDVAQRVLRKAKRHAVIAPETADLKHYAWLVHRAALYFGGDTGPMHIAAAMGTPVAAVFGGTDPVQHAPATEPVEILYAAEKGLTPEQRLRAITPDQAYDACIRLLGKRRA
ncbi:MAG: glycosyltransferase family 9 protein [Candidatus Hydrogenedentes bacterium]|nr:glycosyltransferase family 9 protein [Candidatus Hydrogenedentota bacterium]